MTPARAGLRAVTAGFVLALASSLVGGDTVATYPDIMGCERGCTVAAAGWPFPYVADYPGLSPGGTAGLGGLVLGLDRPVWPAFVATWACWSLAALSVALLISRSARARR